jgi:hypothetical protein
MRKYLPIPEEQSLINTYEECANRKGRLAVG